MVNDHGFGIASANIHHNKFHDEIIVLDTLGGCYFSLRGSAIDIWLLVEAGASRSMMVESLAARYEGDREAFVAAVDYCLPQLLEHGIIRETEAKSVTLESIR